MVGPTTTVIQPTSTGLTKVDSARDIVLVRSKIRNNSANTPKSGLKLYRLNSAKNTTTIRPVTITGELAHSKDAFSLADGIRRTLASPNLLAMRENCVEMIQSEFAWQQEARYYTDLYRSLTDNHELLNGGG